MLDEFILDGSYGKILRYHIPVATCKVRTNYNFRLVKFAELLKMN